MDNTQSLHKDCDCNFHPDICQKICSEFIRLSLEAAQLKCRAKDKENVNKAKWALVRKKNMSEREAHDFIMKTSRANRRVLAETAALILSGGDSD